MTTQPRSTFVSVVAWIFIVFSSFGVFIMSLETLMFFLIPFEELAKQSAQDNAQVVPALFFGIMRGFMVFMLLAAVWFLVASIGLLLRKNWGRINFIILMVISILFQVLGIIWAIIILVGMSFFGDAMQAEADMEFIQTFMWVVSGFSVLFSVAFIVLYGWIIKKLTSPAIKAEFLPVTTTTPPTMS